MAFQSYLWISGIDGEVLAPPAFAKSIKILSFHWGVQQTRRAWENNPSGTGVVHDFSIVKAVDKTSPDLFSKCAMGDSIATVQVDLTRSDGRVVTKYAEYVFKEVFIYSVRPGGGGGSDVPLEEVGFNFKEGTFKYENATKKF
jgi:type VI secretion system secreted protein Hcp